jgi:heme exporter protein C
VLGTLTLIGMAILVVLALVVTPADEHQGDAVRLLYLHVGSALTAFLAFGVTALGSIVYLWRRTDFWDLIAAASAEVGVVLTGLCLVSGSLWGRPVWGVYWTWDARLTSTALLFVLFAGYLALRRVLIGSPSRAKWSAVAGLIAAVDLPIVHYSTVWWSTLHQGPTITRLNPSIQGSMLFTLMFSMLVFLLLYWWLMLHRFRVEYLELREEEAGLDVAIAERRAEATADLVPGGVAR